MLLTDVNLFGIYIAPFAVMMVIAWAVTAPLRRMGDRLGIARHVWHPALFNFAVYVIVLCLMVIAAGSV